jgi:hypothetical protein
MGIDPSELSTTAAQVSGHCSVHSIQQRCWLQQMHLLVCEHQHCLHLQLLLQQQVQWQQIQLEGNRTHAIGSLRRPTCWWPWQQQQHGKDRWRCVDLHGCIHTAVVCLCCS